MKKNFLHPLMSVCNAVVSFCEKAVMSPRFASVVMLLMCVGVVMAQNGAGDYSAGVTALGTVTTEIAKYVPVAVKLCYAIAGVVAVVGAIIVIKTMTKSKITRSVRQRPTYRRQHIDMRRRRR